MSDLTPSAAAWKRAVAVLDQYDASHLMVLQRMAETSSLLDRTASRLDESGPRVNRRDARRATERSEAQAPAAHG
jgi:hypothetical protein